MDGWTGNCRSQCHMSISSQAPHKAYIACTDFRRDLTLTYRSIQFIQVEDEQGEDRIRVDEGAMRRSNFSGSNARGTVKSA